MLFLDYSPLCKQELQLSGSIIFEAGSHCIITQSFYSLSQTFNIFPFPHKYPFLQRIQFKVFSSFLIIFNCGLISNWTPFTQEHYNFPSFMSCPQSFFSLPMLSWLVAILFDPTLFVKQPALCPTPRCCILFLMLPFSTLG